MTNRKRIPVLHSFLAEKNKGKKLSIKDRLKIERNDFDIQEENSGADILVPAGRENGEKFNAFAELLRDKNIDKIFVNNNSVYIEKRGREYKSNLSFSSPAEFKEIITKLSENSKTERKYNEGMLDFKLGDGTRVLAILPPCTTEFPVLYITKTKNIEGTLESLVGLNCISKEISLFLEAVSNLNVNVLITGAKNCGKTTLLGAMAKKIQNNKRILTFEKNPELKLNQDQVIRLFSDDRSLAGDLLLQGLEFNPDKIVLDECSRDSIGGLLEGAFRNINFIATTNANSIRHAIENLECMFELNQKNRNTAEVKNFVLKNIDLIIELKRFDGGAIRVCEIVEVSHEDTPVLNRIFYWDYKNGIDGGFYSGGIKPEFLDNTGFEICDLIFEKKYEHTNNEVKGENIEAENVENQIKELYSYSKKANFFKKFRKK